MVDTSEQLRYPDRITKRRQGSIRVVDPIQPFKARPSLMAVFVVLGFVVAVSFNTYALSSAGRSGRSADLAGIVEQMEAQQAALTDEIAGRRATLDALERSAAEESGERTSFTNEAESTRAAAGLTQVTGPGVVVTLDDAAVVPAGDDPNRYIIHDFDIAAVVNALLAGGAEAVEVNGQRIIATTAIRCAGTTILVNQTRLGAPYVVAAIGDAGRMSEALEADIVAGELLGNYRIQYGLDIRLEKKTSLTVAAYAGGLRPKYATPVEGE